MKTKGTGGKAQRVILCKWMAEHGIGMIVKIQKKKEKETLLRVISDKNVTESHDRLLPEGMQNIKEK